MTGLRLVRCAGISALLGLAALPAWPAPAQKPAGKSHRVRVHSARPHRQARPARKTRQVASTRQVRKHTARMPGPTAPRVTASPATLAPLIAPTFLTLGRFAQCGTTGAAISFTDLRLSIPEPVESIGSEPGSDARLAEPVSEGQDTEPEPDSTGAPAPQAVSFIGFVERQSGDLRVAVLRVDGRVVYGREGDVVAGRYRLLRFSEEKARVFDLSSSLTRTLAMASQLP